MYPFVGNVPYALTISYKDISAEPKHIEGTSGM